MNHSKNPICPCSDCSCAVCTCGSNSKAMCPCGPGCTCEAPCPCGRADRSREAESPPRR